MSSTTTTIFCLWLLFVPVGRLARADSSWVYAVQLSAQVQSAPPQITLQWPPDQYGANTYTVYRKAMDDTWWGNPIATLPGSATSYTDFAVSIGATYEYQVVKDAMFGYQGYGYIYSGIQADLTDNRGTLVLVVASNIASPLSAELSRLQSDLVGDGWQVIRHEVPVEATPDEVRNLIQADYAADPAHVNTVFLVGHVPILQSGFLDYDGHGDRPMPADGFYGDMHDDWPTDPTVSPSFFPSKVQLMVGRVDLYDMPGLGASPAWGSEIDLLRQYLNKDHNWRFKLLTVPRRALMANRIGDLYGVAPAATGYRNFEPLVGPGNTIEANVQDNAPPNERWISLVTAGPYLWSYGCGGGGDTLISQLGLHGLYNDAWSTDVVGQDAQAAFVMFNGSHFASWDHTDNLLRSVLATPTCGLTACLAGEPHWFLHHMGLGETIGFATRLTMNNDSLYQNQSNYLARAVYIGLMGDPTLRMEPIAPPSNLSASSDSGFVTLNWSASPEATAGYHLYRSLSPAGPFARISTSPLHQTSFRDAPGTGTYTYMVRAIALQTNPSGSYYNPSEAVFVTTSNSGNVVPPILLSVARADKGVQLTWTTEPGMTYRVQARDSLDSATWNDLSGTITASAPATTWTDPNTLSVPQRLYRIISP